MVSSCLVKHQSTGCCEVIFQMWLMFQSEESEESILPSITCVGLIQSLESLIRKKNEVLQRGKILLPYSLYSKSTLDRISRLLACPVDFRLVSPHNYMSQFLRNPSSTSFLSAHLVCVCVCVHVHLHTYTHTSMGFVLLDNPDTVVYWEALLAFLISFPSSKSLSSEKKNKTKKKKQANIWYYGISWFHSTDTMNIPQF